MSALAQGQIDGVPVFHGDDPGPLAAALIFRVGQADEALVGRGTTHLIEHLALAPLTGTYRTSNGRVGMTLTHFDVEGDPEDVAGFLTGVAGALAALPYDRLGTERRILRTEDQRRSGSLGSLAYGLRFGPAAYGTVDCPELGLFRATHEGIEGWRRRFFTRGNAALWLSGPVPEGIDLSALPDGDRVAPPPPRPYPYRYPAWYPAADAYVALSLLGRRSTALWAAQAILQERLYARLREREGRSYEVSVSYDPLTGEDAGILLVADTLPQEAENVRDAVAVEVQRLARGEATEDELADLRDLRDRARQDPGFAASTAHRAAVETLLAGAAEPPDELDAKLAALTGTDVGAALREAMDSALWLVPDAIGMHDRRVHPLPMRSELAVEGRTFVRPPGVDDELAGDVLVVGPGGVTLAEPDRPPITVTRDACVALQGFEDRARVVWGADSIRLFVHPAMWSAGTEAIAAIDALFEDPSIRVPMGEPSGFELPAAVVQQQQPAGESGGGLLRRWRRG